MHHIKKALNTDEICYLLRIFADEGHKSRLVGGCVRDAILEKPFEDFDIATTARPEEVMSMLQNNGVKAVPTGIKHGTITAILNGKPFEITTLRKDIKCDGRWAEVSFTKSFEEDAARRDFTINALSYCPFSEKVFDYFDGLTHLKNKQVIFIGDAQRRIEEDHLRILRFFRFSGYYATSFDETGLQASLQHAELLRNISKERIKMEFDKILALPFEKLFFTLQSIGQVLNHAFYPAEPQLAFMIKVANLAVELAYPIKPYELYILLIHNGSIEDIKKLKLPSSYVKEVKALQNVLTQAASGDATLQVKKAWVHGDPAIFYILVMLASELIQFDTAQNLIYEIRHSAKPIFPIKAQDLMQLGYSGGELGSMLEYLESKWLESNFQLSREELIKCIPE